MVTEMNVNHVCLLARKVLSCLVLSLAVSTNLLCLSPVLVNVDGQRSEYPVSSDGGKTLPLPHLYAS